MHEQWERRITMLPAINSAHREETQCPRVLRWLFFPLEITLHFCSPFTRSPFQGQSTVPPFSYSKILTLMTSQTPQQICVQYNATKYPVYKQVFGILNRAISFHPLRTGNWRRKHDTLTPEFKVLSFLGEKKNQWQTSSKKHERPPLDKAQN